MRLDQITGPEDLRGLSVAEAEALAQEMRTFIVHAVSETGGHLGSNLGAVELALAVHRTFRSPQDVILWDTGHQAYPHKIITGRAEGFTRLRQEGGLSGYPSRAESEHDWIENSHASTVLSYAQGMAVALEGTDRRVVAVIGDGSMTGGMAYEALNNIGHDDTRVVIVLNDNGRSYAPTISRLSLPLIKLRMRPEYVRQRDRAQRMLERLPAIGDYASAGFAALRTAMREAIEPGPFFEALGVRYTGPVDGHDLAQLEEALRAARAYDGPVVVHVLTQKGRGYAPAEDDDEKHLHDAPVFDPLTGPPVGWSAPKNAYTQTFTEVLLRAAEADDRIHAITAAMPGPTGLLPFQQRFPQRFHDVGIAEQHAATFAAGLALGGCKPVVAVYSTFFTRCFDQAMFDVGLHELPVVFVLDRAGITGPDGPSHHGVLDIGLCLRIPGMAVFAPSSAQELAAMLPEALAWGGPAAVRFARGAARQVEPGEVGEGLAARCSRPLADGTAPDVCFLAVGKLVEAAEEAAEKLAADGVGVTVWDPRVIRPTDPGMLQDAMRHRVVVTCEDGQVMGGAGQLFARQLADRRGPDEAGPKVVVLGTPVAYIPHGTPQSIHAALGLDAPGLARTALEALGAR